MSYDRHGDPIVSPEKSSGEPEAVQKVICSVKINLANINNCPNLKKKLDSPSANAAEIYDR